VGNEQLAPWFQWNGTDLTQFGSQIIGSKVGASAWTVVSFAGVNWIQGTLTNGAGAANGAQTITALPFGTPDPPSANNIVVADWIVWQFRSLGGTDWVGAIAFVFLTSTSNAMWVRFATSGQVDQQKFEKAAGAEAITAIGQPQSDPNTFTAQESGMRLGMAAEASDDGDIIITGLMGERQVIVDTDRDVSISGPPGIGISGGTVNNGQTIVRFRNIRAYTIPELSVGVAGW
jgi:hypothetical protein